MTIPYITIYNAVNAAAFSDKNTVISAVIT